VNALTLTGPSLFEYGPVPDPEVGPGDVLIEVRACGICGSDVHGMDGSSGRRLPPIVMGHEASGVIRSLAPDVTGWAPGDRVTFDSTIWCGSCVHCRGGRVNLCDRRRVLGVSVPEYRQPGAFAELLSIPARILQRLPDEVTFVQGSLVEPLSVVLHAIARAGDEIEEPVVVGAGVIGLLTVQGLKARGCERVIIIDIDAGRLLRAEAFGALPIEATHPEALAETVWRATSREGPDVVFEAVGGNASVASAIGMARKGGRVVLVGNVSPRVDLPLQDVVSRELTLLGSAASNGEFPAALALIAERRVDVDALVSAVVPLQDGAAWMRRLRTGEPDLLKVILEP
jgi:L-iditol 2-dehydrogenase